ADDSIRSFHVAGVQTCALPISIYDEPQTRFVAEFIGETNLAEGTIERVEGTSAFIRLNDGGTLTASSRGALAAGQKVLLSIRPEDRTGVVEGRDVQSRGAWGRT